MRVKTGKQNPGANTETPQTTEPHKEVHKRELMSFISIAGVSGRSQESSKAVFRLQANLFLKSDLLTQLSALLFASDQIIRHH